MKISVACIGIFLSVVPIKEKCGNSESNTARENVKTILSTISEPVFRDKVYNIVDFGAIADGITKNTEAINAAIAKCNSEGGGQVHITNGNYLTGAIHMLSNVNLHIDENAVLLFTTDPKDYLPLVPTRWEGDDCYNYSPLIYATGQSNFAVTGKGMLNGQASTKDWWLWKGGTGNGWKKGMPCQLDKNSRPLLKKYNDTQTPVEKRQMGEGH